jgi:hypothetical protein
MSRQGIYWPKGRNFCYWPRVITSSQKAKQRYQKKNAAALRLRSAARMAFKRTRWMKNGSTQELMGCTFDEAKAWLERQFSPGMGWHNMEEWEVDHVVPISTARSK